MNFDEFLAKRGYIRGYKHDYQTAYDYGVESQQQEIDKLQAELEALQGMYNAVSITAGEMIDECNVLQKRINELKVWCINGVECGMLSTTYNQALIDMLKILKGV